MQENKSLLKFLPLISFPFTYTNKDNSPFTWEHFVCLNFLIKLVAVSVTTLDTKKYYSAVTTSLQKTVKGPELSFKTHRS